MKGRSAISNQRLQKFLIYWVPVIIYAAFIFYLSSISFAIKRRPFPHYDKVLHLFIYGILCLLFGRALKVTVRDGVKIYVPLIAILLTIGYGIFDEYHQSYTPMRRADIQDVFADGLGAVAAQTALFIKRFLYR